MPALSHLSHLPQTKADERRVKRNGRLFVAAILAVMSAVALQFFGPHSSDTDPSTLKAGDCFKKTGSEDDQTVEKLDCGDPDAGYKVVKMDKDAVVDTFACQDAPGTTGSLTQAGAESFVICFKKNA